MRQMIFRHDSRNSVFPIANASCPDGENLALRVPDKGMTFGRLMISSTSTQAAFKRASPHSGGAQMERKKASDFPQELLNLFDGYVHGGISRRDFLARAQKFAVGGVTAAALLQMLK